MAQPISEAALAEIADYVFARKKIQAIKSYRAATGAGLMEAKNAVEAIEAQLQATEPGKFAAVAPSRGCVSMVLVVLVPVGFLLLVG